MKKNNSCLKKVLLLLSIVFFAVFFSNNMSKVQAEESVNGSNKAYNLANFNYSFTTVDGESVSSKANGRPKVLIFYGNGGNCFTGDTFLDMSRISDYGNVDILAIDYLQDTKEKVIEYREQYATNLDCVKFCYSTSDNYVRYMWNYLLAANPDVKYASIVAVYIDAKNVVQYITQDRTGASEIISNLKKYCGFKTNINILPTSPEIYKISNVVSGVSLYWKKTEGNEYYTLCRLDWGTEGGWKVISRTLDTHFIDTDVKTGMKYSYYLYKNNWAGGTTDITYLDTPDVTTRVNRSGGIGITWTRVKGATGYAIYRKTYWGTDSWVRIATIRNPNQNKWDDTSVKDNNGKMYKYTVKALGYSDFSLMSGCRSNGRTMVRMTTRTLCSVDKATANSVKCHWMPTKHCDGYEVRFMVGNSVYKTFAVGDYKTGIKTFAGLKAGRTYKVQVRSYKKVNNVGTFYSAWSNEKYIKL